ncbi:hypothetical protein [Methylobacterium planeticum]|uniref:Uncharacterized protein n=1 Tax=Methylobacterium planeticum TaxID=2615211 RepID=A0A6N6MK01_9HYPH|nr:hypothetical protein [Methylobacterium planeticum]KAB1069938.1 hypothetical protein F6X51_24165 [Methylobacterium planeticum]
MAEFDDLRSLLVLLPSFQKARADYTVDEGELADKIAETHGRAERDQLEALIDVSSPIFDMAARNLYVYLTPYSAHGNTYLPLLAVAANYPSAARPSVNVWIILYSKGAHGTECLCYRFDTPNRTIGDHNYFHMQFTTNAPESRRNRHAVAWISKKDPSIPLDATTPLEMFLGSIISFRSSGTGLAHVHDQWRQSGVRLAAMVNDMAAERWKRPWMPPL